MRSGTSSTERGNTYEQRVRAWRLAELVADTLTEHDPPRSITFQHAELRPWDDIVEATAQGFVAWQVKDLDNPLPKSKLAELLRALHTTPAINRGVLAMSHALTRPSGLDLMVVRGLADASRIAKDKLPRFAPDQKEHRTLTDVAELIGHVDPADAFRTLARFDVVVLHGKPDVQAMTQRALHPLFERPEELARALLELVVDTAAPGVELHFDTLESEVLRGFARRRTPWVPVSAGPPDEEVLLWRRDGRGRARTLWLSSQRSDLVVADLPGMLLGSENDLWRWETCAVLVPFADDEGYVFEGDDPVDEDTVELCPVDSARLTNVVHGAVIPLGIIEHPGAVGAWVMSLDHIVEPIGTFGHVFLSVARAGGYSGGAHGWSDADFIVLDLQTGQSFDLLSETEAEDYITAHGEDAKRRVPEATSTTFGEEEKIDDPRVTICTPYYDESYTLRLRLQLTFETCYGDTDETWGDYHASTTAEAKTLPKTLAPLATAPAVLRTYWDEHPMDERCGWTHVPTSGPAREQLERLVREQQARSRSDHS